MLGQPPASPAALQEQQSPVIAVHSDMVVLPVSVTDRRGRLVSTLRAENFRVYEDAQEQKIAIFQHEDIPVTVGLLVDRSGSMGPILDEVRKAASSFAETSNPRDEIFVVTFNEHVTLALPADVSFTGDVHSLERALSGIQATGRTALYDAIWAGLDHLKKGHREKKVLLVITDGGDNASRIQFTSLLRRTERTPALLYFIGIYDEDDPDQNPGVLRRLARLSGGKSFFPKSAAEVTNISREVARELREQYTLGYVPNERNGGTPYHTIRVVAAARGLGKLTVRTRAGYSSLTLKTAAPAQPDGVSP